MKKLVLALLVAGCGQGVVGFPYDLGQDMTSCAPTPAIMS